jgi:cation:H+ antiporter
MELAINFSTLIVGFVLLIKGAEYMVEGASALARKLKVSELVIGLSIISIGTSAPELMINIISSFKGYNGLVFGNVIGSNLFNILLVLGVAGVISSIEVSQSTVWKEIPFSLLAAIILYVLVNDGIFNKSYQEGFSVVDSLSYGDGIILLIFFLIFLVYVFSMAKVEAPAVSDAKIFSLTKSLIFTIGGIVGLMAGGEVVVSSAINIAKTFSVSEKLIGLTIVAAGTSLPELATTAVAAYKKKSDIAMGNILGSNIFNIFFILGTSASIHPTVYDPSLNSDLLFLIFASFLLFIFMFTGKKKGSLTRFESIIFLAMFAGYMFYIIQRG